MSDHFKNFVNDFDTGQGQVMHTEDVIARYKLGWVQPYYCQLLPMPIWPTKKEK